MNPINLVYIDPHKSRQLEAMLMPPVTDLTANPNLTMALDKRGVLYVISADDHGSFVMETSLAKMSTAVSHLNQGAISKWGMTPYPFASNERLTNKAKDQLMARIKAVIEEEF